MSKQNKRRRIKREEEKKMQTKGHKKQYEGKKKTDILLT